MWRLNLSSKEAAGVIDFMLEPDGGLAQVFARLSRLSVPDAGKADVESAIEHPSTIPALDVVIDDFKLGSMGFGRIEIDAVNQGDGALHSWRLNRFRMTLPEATVSANGAWSNSLGSPRKSTDLNFDVTIRDAGALLNRVGQSGNLTAGQGALSGSVAWVGSPITPDIPSLSGHWKVKLQNGEILKINPGAGRLLGILSLQALPRLFLLDFRNAFSDGFVFDDFSGDIHVLDGLANTDNLRLKSLLVDVHTKGTVDFVRRKQDLKVLIEPEINVGTASLAIIAVNPVLGWSTLLAQGLFRTPLKGKVTQHMHVTGTWADPQVKKIPASAPKAP
jgi:uncharacterized protein YhdP